MHSLKPLLYFSLFKYPLTEEEIYGYSNESSKEKIKEELNNLVHKNIIYNIDGFYLFKNDTSWVSRRLAGNQNAKEIHPKAVQVSKLISKFPYVEGVGISGSLSKGYYDDESDIDFFIITTHKRLWIARTFLILYKKLFLLNSRKFFCVNYFISDKQLEIDEKNRFTATELVTLIPMFGNGSFHEFYKQNEWTKQFFPNKKNGEILKKLNYSKKPYFTKGIEKLFNTKLGDWLDQFFLKITYKKWKQKFNNLDKAQFNIALKSTQNVSKHHPSNFQRKVIERLNSKYEKLQKKHNIQLAKEHA